MRRRIGPRNRRAVVALESALVYPVLLAIFLGLIVGGMGVFRYLQVACQAREAARYAAVHGGNWQKATSQSSPTQAQIYQNTVEPLLAGMDPDSITFQVQWINQATGDVVAWDTASKTPTAMMTNGNSITNTVRVTITYQWSPQLLFGTLNMTSTCEVPMMF